MVNLVYIYCSFLTTTKIKTQQVDSLMCYIKRQQFVFELGARNNMLFNFILGILIILKDFATFLSFTSTQKSPFILCRQE